MSETKDVDPAKARLASEYDLDAPPEKVWRAMTIPAFRERWLPGVVLSDPQSTETSSSRKIRFQMRDDEAAFVDSVVTFEVWPNGEGGATLRILHELEETSRAPPTIAPANLNRPPRMRAA
jgi:uncharacterized protein YndB with AHSA1/START domain